MRNAGFAEMIDFTRPGTATYVDADGMIRIAAADVPRFDYTNGRRQLLLEGPRSNFVRYSNYIEGSAWNDDFEHNGVRAVLVGTGLYGDVHYADYELTGTMDNGQATPFVTTAPSIAQGAVEGESWTASVYTQLISGDWPAGSTLGAGVFELDATNSYITGNADLTNVPRPDLVRASVTRTLSASGTTNARSSLQILGTAGETAFDGQIVRVFGWQLEKGNYPSSLVPTSGNAVVRPADCATLNDSIAALFLRGDVSLLVKASDLQGSGGRILGVDANKTIVQINYGEDQIIFNDPVVRIAGDVSVPLAPFGIAIGYSETGRTGTFNGAVPNGDATSLPDLSKIYIGRFGDGRHAEGWYDQLIIWPFRVTDEDLQRLAVPYA